MSTGDGDRWMSADEADDLDLLRRSAVDALASNLPPAAAARLGWTGLLSSADLGGEGWFPASAAVIATETGAAVHRSGWMSAALAAGALVGDEASEWRAGVLAGDLTAAFGIARDGLGRSGVWTGSARVTSDDEPDVFVVVTGDGSSAWAWACQADAAGVSTTAVALDTTRVVADVVATDVTVVELIDVDATRILAAAVLLGCADSVGALRSTLKLVTDHLVERRAFGASLASMQALQHRIVEHDVVCTAADALVKKAARRLEAGDAPSIEVWAAPTYVHRRVIAALDDCIQLAGGIGFTWEYPVHHALRRAVVTETLGVAPTTGIELLSRASSW